MSRTVAFIGLGHMGGPMAGNLVKAGYRVLGHDLVPAALDSAAAAGVEPAASTADAVAGAEVVISMLPAGRQVLGLYYDILAAGSPAPSSSTAPPSTSPTPAPPTNVPWPQDAGP